MENKKRFIINILFYSLIVGILFLIYKYALSIFMPFIVGFFMAFISLKISRKLFNRQDKAVKTITLIVLYLIIIVLITILAVFTTGQLLDFIYELPSLIKTALDPFIAVLEKKLTEIQAYVEFETIISQTIDGLYDAVKSLVSDFSSSLVSIITSIIAYTPTLLISIMVVFISSFYFLYDYDLIMNSMVEIIPENVKKEYFRIRHFVVTRLFSVIKSYGIIMFITFIQLLIGFFIVGVKNYFLVALFTSVVDVLPVLGVGTVLIPWGIIAIISGESFLGFGLLILYIIITIIRNIIEPKFVGSDLNLHPLLTLVLMIVGMDLCGIFGLFAFPIICSYLINRKEELKNVK